MYENHISVIITAHNRKEYLLNAIKSVINQTLDKRYYEIIVVKNFNDNIIDKFIEENKIKSILTDKMSFSGKILDGLKIANGNIISFLDDDDMFFNNKLENVNKIFDDDIVYYHNSEESIGDNGKKLDFFNNSADFNMSSISIRKDIINEYILSKVTHSIDTLMYLCALESNKKIIKGKEKLTYYMVHNSISHIVTNNFEKYKKFIITTSDLALNSYILFNNLFHSKKAIKFLNSKTTGVQIYKYIYGSNEFPSKLINYIINSSGSLKYRVAFFLSCILIKVYPKSRKYINSKIWDIHSKWATEAI